MKVHARAPDLLLSHFQPYDATHDHPQAERDAVEAYLHPSG